LGAGAGVDFAGGLATDLAGAGAGLAGADLAGAALAAGLTGAGAGAGLAGAADLAAGLKENLEAGFAGAGAATGAGAGAGVLGLGVKENFIINDELETRVAGFMKEATKARMDKTTTERIIIIFVGL